jgi:hypothetical protein
MEASSTYSEMITRGGLTGIVRLFTLGVGAHILRNFGMSFALLPKLSGSDDFSV